MLSHDRETAKEKRNQLYKTFSTYDEKISDKVEIKRLFLETLAHHNLNEIEGQLHYLLTQISKKGSKKKWLLELDIQVHYDQLLYLQREFIEQIKTSLVDLAEKIPTNTHNIKECLLYGFAPEINRDDAERSVALLRQMKHAIRKTTDNEDYQQGFEDGYEKALKNLSHTQTKILDLEE